MAEQDNSGPINKEVFFSGDTIDWTKVPMVESVIENVGSAPFKV